MFIDERDINKIKYMDPLEEHVKEFARKYNNFYIMFLTEHEPDVDKSFQVMNQYMLDNNIIIKI